MKKILVTIVILAALGVGVSSYALWQHYTPLGAGFCNLGETFSCDLVNKSAFSEVFGIPVALLGMVGYAGIAALAIAARTTISPPPAGLPRPERRGRGSDLSREALPRPSVASREGGAKWERGWGIRSLLLWLLAASFAGLAFSLYLSYVEFFVIGAVCILCVISQVLILGISTTSAVAYRWVRA